MFKNKKIIMNNPLNNKKINASLLIETKLYLLPIGPDIIVYLFGCLIVFKIRSLAAVGPSSLKFLDALHRSIKIKKTSSRL